MLQNTTIKARLAFVLLLLSALMLGIGLMGLINLSNTNASLKTVYEDRLLAVGQLDRVIRSGNRMQLAIALASTEDPAQLPELFATIERERGEAQKVWGEYIARHIDADEQKLVTQFDDARKRFAANGLKPAMAAALHQDMQLLSALAHGKLQEEYLAVGAALDRLIKLQIDVSKDEYEKSQRSYGLVRGVAFSVLALGLFSALAVGIWLVRNITQPLDYAVQVAQGIAAGDLRRQVTVTSTNETGKLLQAMQAMNDSLVRIVGEVRAGTDTIATASSQIAAGNLDLSSRTEQQASSLEETASSMEELTSTVRQNSDNARQANQLAVSASNEAIKGGAVVAEVIATMGAIHASAKKIVDIISVIDGIAFQTNILALNAAVEAARAGEQGRGFAVVASEVRNLAQRSASAAKEIKILINDSVEQVDAGSKLVDQAGTTMNEVVHSAKRVSDIITEIMSASHKQSSGIDQINQAIAQMDEVTQQNAALVEEAAAAAGSLQDQAEKLSVVVGVFKVDAMQAGRGVAAARQMPSVKPVAAFTAARGARPVQPTRQLASSAKSVSDWEEF